MRAVGRHRPGVEVALMSQSGETVGFFPFFRDGPVARPYAGQLTSLQGAIVRPGVEWDPRELLEGCGLSAWCFDNLLVSQAPLAPHHEVRGEAPFMDLSAGFEAYRRERRAAGSDELQNVLRKARKIRREVGEVRLVMEPDPRARDAAGLEGGPIWRRRRLPNALSASWVRPLLTGLIESPTPACAGVVAALYVDEELAAATVGVRSERVLHGWVTAYSRRFAKYSPGLLLVVELARAVAAQGVQRIEMGRGPEPYKRGSCVRRDRPGGRGPGSACAARRRVSELAAAARTRAADAVGPAGPPVAEPVALRAPPSLRFVSFLSDLACSCSPCPESCFGRFRQLGLLGCLGWFVERLGWRLFEARWGLRTSGSIAGRQLGHGGDQFGYQPIDHRSLQLALNALSIDADDVFVDIGCGLGRAVVLAARRPFRRVLGVEYSPSLAEAACRNVRRCAAACVVRMSRSYRATLRSSRTRGSWRCRRFCLPSALSGSSFAATPSPSSCR